MKLSRSGRVSTWTRRDQRGEKGYGVSLFELAG